MTQGRWILAIVALLLWAASPSIFFSRDLRRWWKTRVPRRARALAAAREKAEGEARVRDELAAKYPLPPSLRTPDSNV